MSIPALLRGCHWLVLAGMLTTTLLPAQEDAEKLRKAAQNPVASMISFPVQENWNFGIQPEGRVQNVMNIQPVIPIDIGKNWNLITRWITPVVSQPIPTSDKQGYYGLGDLNPSFFISPKVSKVIWGVGPTLVLPTATNSTYLGQGKFSIGPSAVVLVQPKKWTLGFLVNNVFSVAGNHNRADVNQMLFQYFINYNLKKGYYFTFQPTMTANWKAPQDKWVVPFGGGMGRIMKLGAQPVNINVQLYGNAIHPPGQSNLKLVAQIAFLFPTGKKK